MMQEKDTSFFKTVQEINKNPTKAVKNLIYKRELTPNFLYLAVRCDPNVLLVRLEERDIFPEESLTPEVALVAIKKDNKSICHLYQYPLTEEMQVQAVNLDAKMGNKPAVRLIDDLYQAVDFIHFREVLSKGISEEVSLRTLESCAKIFEQANTEEVANKQEALKILGFYEGIAEQLPLKNEKVRKEIQKIDEAALSFSDARGIKNSFQEVAKQRVAWSKSEKETSNVARNLLGSINYRAS